MKKKLHLFLKKLIFSQIILFSLVSCKFSWFTDFREKLDADTTMRINYYASNTSEVYFTRKYISGTELDISNLPDKNDKEVKALNPGFDLKGWKFYRSTKTKETYVPIDVTLDGNNYVESLVAGFVDYDFYAEWDYATDTPYTVEYYFQPVNGSISLSDYEIKSSYTKHLTGTTMSQTEAEKITVPGFECQNVQQETIAADGSTVVKIYLNRNIVTIKLINPNDSSVTEYSGLYEADVVYDNLPKRDGYRISKYRNYKTGQIEEPPVTYPAENITYTIVWEAIPVEYEVNYYIQNLDDDDYTLYSSVDPKPTGTAGEKVVVNPITIEGFTIDSDSYDANTTISADGSTVVNVNYNRNVYTLKFDFTGGLSEGAVTDKSFNCRYGRKFADISGINDLSVKEPEKTGYRFAGWSTNSSASTGIALSEIISDGQIGNSDITYYAIWKPLSTNTVKVTIPSIEDSSVDAPVATVDTDNSKITITAASGYSSYKWLFDGVYDSSSSSNVYECSIPSKTGYYNILVIITDSNGTVYTAEIEIEVTKDEAGI